jgi:hypothetical protein
MIRYITPPALAKLWQCKPSKIITWIRNGELEAINMARDPGGRPRYRITPEAIKKFEQRRTAQPAPKQPRRYRKPKSTDFIEYIQ